MLFSSLSPITINTVRLSAFDMTYPYQNILLIGATSGIGYAFAEKLAEDGKHMMVVGRRQDKLDELVNKYGKEKASSIRFDITDLEGIPGFVARYLLPFPAASQWPYFQQVYLSFYLNSGSGKLIIPLHQCFERSSEN